MPTPVFVVRFAGVEKTKPAPRVVGNVIASLLALVSDTWQMRIGWGEIGVYDPRDGVIMLLLLLLNQSGVKLTEGLCAFRAFYFPLRLVSGGVGGSHRPRVRPILYRLSHHPELLACVPNMGEGEVRPLLFNTSIRLVNADTNCKHALLL